MKSPAQQPSHAHEAILTQLDVDRLLADPSANSRTAVLERVSECYNANAFKPRERDIAEQIFRLLMKDAVMTVREILSQRIQNNPSIPRDIVLHIAKDTDSVALPVLTNSKVFSDADLVAIIESSKELSKLLAITRRDTISPRVSDALVDTSYPNVVSSLLANKTAEISPQAFDKIVDDFRNEPTVITSMLHRQSLPLAVIERVINEASAAVASQFKEKYHLSEQQLKPDTLSTREDVLFHLLSTHISEAELQALVKQMHSEGRLTFSLVMTALCRGQLAFFTAAMARMVGVSSENAKTLLADKGNLGFRALYERACFPEAMCEAARLIFIAARQLEHSESIPGSRQYANHLAEQVLNAVGDENIEYMPYFMALIRQNIQPH